MCGVFGFVAASGCGVDLAAVKRIAKATESRGRHAFGFAWVDSAGRLKAYKQRGRISDSLGLLAMARDARILIGHCRYTTQGTERDNINNHPHPADGGWIVHNGMIGGYAGIVQKRRLHPVSGCDSELLGLLIERSRGTLLERCAAAADACAGGSLVMLGVWPRPGRLIAVRAGNPLQSAEAEEGAYFASLADGLPGSPAAVPDGVAMQWDSKGRVKAAPLAGRPAGGRSTADLF